MRLCANESYQSAEAEIEALTGVKVGHTTHQRLVLRQQLSWPEAKQAVTEVSVDGGKVRLRSQTNQGGYWRDYKAVRLQGMYYGAFFGDNQSLIDYVNSQPLTNPLVCLGDGHEGVWNLVKEFATSSSRWEILDWYHLAEALLWEGQVEAVRTVFSHCRLKQAKNFCAYLEQHHQRIVNYSYYQSEQLCSIGSGAVESAIKQIGSRIKISGAQWKAENVNQVLSVRCAYLNGLLAL